MEILLPTTLTYSRYQVVVTVRTHDKGRQLLESLSNTGNQAASYVVVEDIAKDGAYDEVTVTALHAKTDTPSVG